jgi:hypothetical protein
MLPASGSWVVHGESVLPASVTMPGTLLSREVVVLPELGSDQDLLLEQVSEVGQRKVRARWGSAPVDVVGAAALPDAGSGVTVWTSPRHVELTGRTDAVVLDEDRAVGHPPRRRQHVLEVRGTGAVPEAVLLSDGYLIEPEPAGGAGRVARVRQDHLEDVRTEVVG